MCKTLKLIRKIDVGLEEFEWHTLRSDLNCNVVEVSAPQAIHAWTVNTSGKNIIYVNTLLENSIKKNALKHELLHIYYGDFQNGDALSVKEARANKRSKN